MISEWDLHLVFPEAKFDIIQNKWVLSEDKLVNYIAQFKKF